MGDSYEIQTDRFSIVVYSENKKVREILSVLYSISSFGSLALAEFLVLHGTAAFTRQSMIGAQKNDRIFNLLNQQRGAAMSDQQDRKVLYLPDDSTLKCKTCYLLRWNFTRGLTHLLSRRKLVVEIEQCIARVCACDIELRFFDTGKIYEPGWCWDDVDARVVSLYLETDLSGAQPKRYCTRILERQR